MKFHVLTSFYFNSANYGLNIYISKLILNSVVRDKAFCAMFLISSRKILNCTCLHHDSAAAP